MKYAVLALVAFAGSALAQPTIPVTPTVKPATAQPSAARTPLPADAAKKSAAFRQNAIAFLKSKQDEKLGAWGVKDGVAAYPAVSGLCLTGILMEPGASTADKSVDAALKYVLSTQKPDGGFYTATLPNYNTAICLMAVSYAKTPEAAASIPKAQAFLKKLQYSESAAKIPGVEEGLMSVEKSHPYYGAWGYGRHGRPDMSNTQWALEALHLSGVPSDDPAFERALVFLQRCQMADSVNDMSYADGSTQGGFIYSTSESKDKVGSGQSQATPATIEETLSDGTTASKLRAYGSMTYSGFKSYIYAGLKADDPRVTLAKKWIADNYTLDENPGTGTDGYYYYIITFARALEATGETSITAKGKAHDWRVDLIDKLATLQQDDGSVKPLDDRWLENDPVLITAYSLIAIQNASK